MLVEMLLATGVKLQEFFKVAGNGKLALTRSTLQVRYRPPPSLLMYPTPPCFGRVLIRCICGYVGAHV